MSVFKLYDKSKFESGRDWMLVRRDLKYLGKFWSWFKRYRHEIVINLDKDCRPTIRPGVGPVSSSEITNQAPRIKGVDTLKWLDENLKGKAFIRVVLDDYHDLMYGNSYEKLYIVVRFTESDDAMFYKLTFGGKS